MQIKLVADVHIGNHNRFARGTMKGGINARASKALDAFRRAVDQWDDPEHTLIVAGDLLDVVRPEPQLLAETQKILNGGCGLAHLLVGNHEQASDLPGDHALGVMHPVAMVTERPQVYVEGGTLVWLLPYRADLKPEDYIESALAEIVNGSDLPSHTHSILVGHFGIEDSRTPVWLRGGHGSIHANKLHEICQRAGISAVFAGDWHEHRSWVFDDGIELVQIGALVPTGFDNPSSVAQLDPANDPYGSVITWDSEKPPGERSSRSVVHGPRFVKTHSSAEVEQAIHDAATHGHSLYLQVTASADAVGEMTRHVESICEPHGDLVRFEVVADHKDVRRRIESAAMSARDAETTERAIAEYVGQMPLDDDLEPAEVNKLAQGFVKGAT